MPRAEHGQRRWPWYGMIAAWLAVMVVAGGSLWRYKLTPAALAAAPLARWPADSAIPLAVEGATLVMVIHPMCACTRASVAELSRLLTEAHGRVHAHVLVVRPPGAPDGWERTELWDRVSAIPDVAIHADVDGVEARGFGATASGHVVIFDPAGRLLFNGGITGARGHEGDNPGRSRASAVIKQTLDKGNSPTFGCDLLDADADPLLREPDRH